jgi:hypothetical protein
MLIWSRHADLLLHHLLLHHTMANVNVDIEHSSSIQVQHEHSGKLSQDDNISYPSTKVVLLAILAIWLAFFVVALASSQAPCMRHSG